MKPLSLIVSSFGVKMDEVLGSVWGWIITIACWVCNYFAGEKLCFCAVFVCILMDAVAGIWSAIKQKKYARSELFRDTCSKMIAYFGALIMVILMERLIGFNIDGTEANLFTGIVAAIICACEFWSTSASFLIINPKLMFFRLIRPALIGEISRKLGITEEDVKNALEQDETLIDKAQR